MRGRNYMRQTPKIAIFLMFSNEKLRGSCWVVVAIFKKKTHFSLKTLTTTQQLPRISHAKSIGILIFLESLARQAPPPRKRYDFKGKYARARGC